jgi:hypothetical protein
LVWRENAAKAWAVMMDWVIEHCVQNRTLCNSRSRRNGLYNIHTFHIKETLPRGRKYAIGASMIYGFSIKRWCYNILLIVPKDQPIENGYKMYRSLLFQIW